MKITKKYHTQKGLTLVEVLAALVILGIVFISIMTVFPQMSLFNIKTETKLDTMNIARQEMTEFVKNASGGNVSTPTIIEPKLINQFDVVGTVSNFHRIDDDVSSTKDDHYLYSFIARVDGGKEFKFEILVFDQPDLSGAVSLYKTILKIKTIENQLSSETYGYIEVK
jgi:prepilin-type N-terminal cleavage/methylation domain-containing protein